MIALKIIICIVTGYLFGNISTAYLVGKLYNVDIRTQGSGNAGATNALRTLGKKAGMMTYAGDALKTIIPIVVFWLLFSDDFEMSLIALLTGFAVVLGHNYPFWLGFKGGKGITVTSAVIMMYGFTYNPLLVLLYIALFAIIVKVTKYVSLGSLIVVTVFLIEIISFSVHEEYYYLYMILGFLFWASAFYSHRANIVRLLNGTENKIGGSKKDE